MQITAGAWTGDNDGKYFKKIFVGPGSDTIDTCDHISHVTLTTLLLNIIDILSSVNYHRSCRLLGRCLCHGLRLSSHGPCQESLQTRGGGQESSIM